MTNVSDATLAVELKRWAPTVTEPETVPVEAAWPPGVYSLSHVALPFPPDDPLYGRFPPEDRSKLFLGQLQIRGERGLMRISSDWLLRLRFNPFYGVLESRTLYWLSEFEADASP